MSRGCYKRTFAVIGIYSSTRLSRLSARKHKRKIVLIRRNGVIVGCASAADPWRIGMHPRASQCYNARNEHVKVSFDVVVIAERVYVSLLKLA